MKHRLMHRGKRIEVSVVPLIWETYLSVIKNSVGANLFRNFYALVNGEKRDILRNGELSCAFFVSSILRMFGLIKEVHCTVDGTVKDLKKSGWRKIKKPKNGSILVWEAIKFPDGEVHEHIGFYIGGGRAISNSASMIKPTVHHYTFGESGGKPTRKITATFWHKVFNEKRIGD